MLRLTGSCIVDAEYCDAKAMLYIFIHSLFKCWAITPPLEDTSKLSVSAILLESDRDLVVQGSICALSLRLVREGGAKPPCMRTSSPGWAGLTVDACRKRSAVEYLSSYQ